MWKPIFADVLQMSGNIQQHSITPSKPRSCLEGVMLLVVEFRSDPAENE